MDIKKEALELQPFLEEFRHDLHMHPELSMQEFRTTDQFAGKLDDWGISYQRFEPTGLMTELVGKADGPLVLLRADIDALPIQETTGLPYASQTEGIMHACGHDTHGTMLLGALKILKDHKDELPGRVRFVFQPGEENGEGARAVIAQGAAKDADMCFGIHSAPDYQVGSIGCCPGPALAATTWFGITVHGKAAHGATPQESCDALTAMCQVVSNLQSIVSRRIPAQWPLVVSVGKISGGTAFNIIPDTCCIEGTCRYFERELNEKVPALLKEGAENVAAAYGCTAEVQFKIHTQPVINDAEVMEIVAESAAKILDSPDLLFDYPQIMAGDDFGDFGNVAPSAYYFLGGGGHGPGHNGNFQVEDEMLHSGAAIYAQVAINALTKWNKIREK